MSKNIFLDDSTKQINERLKRINEDLESSKKHLILYQEQIQKLTIQRDEALQAIAAIERLTNE